jgi:hypothetical protein
MTSGQDEPFALHDVDGVLSDWLLEHPSPDTQQPVVSFLVRLCQRPWGSGEQTVWVPVETGFQAVGISWFVDRDRRLIHLTHVSDISPE